MANVESVICYPFPSAIINHYIVSERSRVWTPLEKLMKKMLSLIEAMQKFRSAYEYSRITDDFSSHKRNYEMVQFSDALNRFARRAELGMFVASWPKIGHVIMLSTALTSVIKACLKEEIIENWFKFSCKGWQRKKQLEEYIDFRFSWKKTKCTTSLSSVLVTLHQHAATKQV